MLRQWLLLQALVLLLDQNNSGSIEFPEFCRLLSAPPNPLNELANLRILELRRSFQWFDVRNIGYFGADELDAAMARLNVALLHEDEPRDVVRRIIADHDGDGDTVGVFPFAQAVLLAPKENKLAAEMGFHWVNQHANLDNATRRASGVDFFSVEKAVDLQDDTTRNRYTKFTQDEVQRYIEPLSKPKGMGREELDLRQLMDLLESSLHMSTIKMIAHQKDDEVTDGLNELCRYVSILKVKKDSVVWKQDDVANKVCIVLKGSFAVMSEEGTLTRADGLVAWSALLYLHAGVEHTLRETSRSISMLIIQNPGDEEQPRIMSLITALLEDLRKAHDKSIFEMDHDLDMLGPQGQAAWKSFLASSSVFCEKIEAMRERAFAMLVLERMLRRSICSRVCLKLVTRPGTCILIELTGRWSIPAAN